MPYYHSKTKSRLKAVLNRIEKSIYQEIGNLQVKAWVTPEPVPFTQRCTGVEREVGPGVKWGNLWDCAWFHFTGTVPTSAAGKKVVLLIDVNGEACVVDNEGAPAQGLTNVNSDFDYNLGKPGKRVVDVTACARGGEVIDLWADAGYNDLFGKVKGDGTFKEAFIAICNEEMRQLFYDYAVLQELMEQLPAERARHAAIMYALNEVANTLRDYTDAEARQARVFTQEVLAKQGGSASLTVSAIGHAHIDLAWLWPLRETIRKGARTFSTALLLMDRYPDYVFGASQPQLYAWVKQHYPSLYARVGRRIAEGRWEAQGAMWVEADTNVSGGEALVRQMLHGKRFFQQEFNQDMKVLWLPDVFGYTGSLPQVLKKSGVDYFMTIKLSWSEHNRFPHHTFLWEGIDGSSVLVHMPPEGTYNSSAAPRAIARAEREYLEKGMSDRCLVLYGIGDGGGGPGEEHLERLQREKNLDGLAPVEQEPSLTFFRRLEKNRARYKTWYGELYLEKHQGTYTTQSRSKRYNRRMEIALRELEFACVQASLHGNFAYPAAELDAIWKEVLLYQFHDILPGSSIKRVYDESLQRYANLLNRVQQLTEQAYASWTGATTAGFSSSAVMVVNSLSWNRNEWVNVGGSWVYVQVPPMGHAVVAAETVNDSEMVPQSLLAANNQLLENDMLRVTFGADGTVESVYDKENGREALALGSPANVLAVYNDTGDAWDFPISYAEAAPESFRLESTTAHIEGPQAIVTQVYSYGQSSLVQDVILTAGSRRLDYHTRVNWQETGKMLRTSFPVNVFAREATCEIQFGTIKRPTHRNTTWEMAKFEVCAHKWVDLSQGDYGVALLNDCKYGHKLTGNILDLNLLRSSTFPDTHADKAEHEFTYSLYPHKGDHKEGQVAREGYQLNIPLQVVAIGESNQGLTSRESLLSVDVDNVLIEAVKQAEDNSDIIVRLYEAHGEGVSTRVQLGFSAKSIELVNLLEQRVDQQLDQQKFDPETMTLTFAPFEIHTLRIRR